MSNQSKVARKRRRSKRAAATRKQVEAVRRRFEYERGVHERGVHVFVGALDLSANVKALALSIERSVELELRDWPIDVTFEQDFAAAPPKRD